MDIERHEAHAQSEIQRRHLDCVDPLWSVMQAEVRRNIDDSDDSDDADPDRRLLRPKTDASSLSIAAGSDWSEFDIEFEDRGKKRRHTTRHTCRHRMVYSLRINPPTTARVAQLDKIVKKVAYRPTLDDMGTTSTQHMVDGRSAHVVHSSAGTWHFVHYAVEAGRWLRTW